MISSQLVLTPLPFPYKLVCWSIKVWVEPAFRSPSSNNPIHSSAVNGRAALGILAAPVYPISASALNFVLPALPFFVEISITPFAPLEPYNEDAYASFKKVTSSISLALIPANVFAVVANLDISPELIMTPSTTNKGEELAETDPIPLIRIGCAAPG